MVAPNSPRLRAKPRIAPANSPGAVSGRVTVTNTSSRPAPSVRAADSRRVSTASSDSRIARTINGKAITAAARAAPCQVNAIVSPKVWCSQPPTGPWRPKVSSSR